MPDEETALTFREAIGQTMGELVKSILGPVAAFGPLSNYVVGVYAFELAEIQRVIFQEVQHRIESAGDDEAKRRVLDEYLADPKRARTFRQGFHAMVDVTASSAWRPLASMTLDYWADGRPTDAFFRDASAVFGQLDDEGLAAIEALLTTVSETDRRVLDAEGVSVELSPGPKDGGTLTWYTPKPTNQGGAPLGTGRGLRLLGSHGFAHERRSRYEFNTNNEERWRALLQYLRLREGRSAASASD